MISTTTAFSNLLTGSSRHFLARIRHGGNVLNCDIKRIRIYKGACGDETLTIGSVYSSYAELTLDGLSQLIENEDIEIQIGMTVSGSPEYITLGKYTVRKVKSTVYESTITAVGYITSKLAVDLPALSAQTIPAIIAAIQQATGLTVSLSGLTSAGTITEPLTSMSCRQALELVTFLLGGYATEKADGNIQISKYQIPSSKLAVNGDRMLSMPTFADNAFTMTGVKVIVSEESYDDEGEPIPEVSYETTTTVRQIYENKYMTQTLFNTFKNNVVGYTYMPGEVDLSLGDPRLEPWDCLAVTDLASNTYNVPCLQIIHQFDGGFSTEVVAPGAAESDVEVEGSITKQLGQVNSELVKAQDGAAKASQAAAAAQADADIAHGAATAAQADAAAASAAAAVADGKAVAAAASATIANTAANTSLVQLSVIEDVAGTLDWISKHGTFTLTTDTTVQEGTVYFVKEGNDYTPIAEPTGNPRSQGWYVLDISDSQSDFIMAHLAVTSRGLWVLPSGLPSTNKTIDNNVDKNTSSDTTAQKQANANARQADNYKVLLSNNGMYLYDGSGRNVTTYGESITFDSARPQTIGNSSTYIKWYDSNNDQVADSIEIAGANVNIASNVTIGGMPTKVSDLTNDSGYQTAYDVDTAISNIEIGGRNLLRNTRTFEGWNLSNSSSGSRYRTVTLTENSPTYIVTFPYDEDSTVYEYISTSNYRFPYSEIRNKNVIFSADVKATNGANTAIIFEYDLYAESTGGSRLKYTNRTVPFTGTGDWNKLIHEREITDSAFDLGSGDVDYNDCYVRVVISTAFTGEYENGIQMKNVKLEVGNKATDWTPAPEDIDAQIDGIQIGGRNILAGTVAAVSKATTSTSGYVTQSLYYTPNRKTLSDLGYVVDDEVTLSFDWKITNATTYGNARIEWYGYKDSSNQDVYLAPLINPFATFSSSNTYGHVNTTVKLTATTVKAKRLLVRIDNSNLTLTISNLKLEKGNKATTWTPAPEDALSKSVPIYGRTNSSTAPTASALPTVIITNTDDTGTTAPSSNGNGWTKMHMPRIYSSNENYKYLWTCNQLISAGGYLLGHTDIVADNGTTVISGDEITTGTVSAERLNIAGTITAINNNTTTTINGGKITTGTIDTNQLKANAVTADKIAANSISADKLRIGDYTNYITATEKDESSLNTGVNPIISNGWLYKSSGTSANIWLSTSHTNWTKSGEMYRVTGTVKAPAAGSATVIIYGRNEDDSSAGSAYYTKVIPADTEVSIDGVIIINDTVANAPKANVGISFTTTSTWTASYQQGYCKNMRCERVSTGNNNLLVDSQKMSGWELFNASLVTRDTTDEFGVVTLKGTSENWSSCVATRPTIRASILDGTPLWLSFEYKASAALTTSIVLSGTANADGSPTTGTRTKYSPNNLTSLPAASSWTRKIVAMPTSLSALTYGSGDVNSLYIQFYNRTSSGATWQIRKVKLERISATDWTPSPEEQRTYVTRIDDNGIRIHPSSTENNSVVINANGMEIFKGGVSVAQYGDTARVGKSSEGNVYVDADSVDIKNGSTVLSTFTSSGAELGKNSDTASIKMCADKFTIKGSYSSTISSNDTFVATINNEHTGLYKLLQLKSGGLLALEDFNGHKVAQLSAEGAQVITEYDETDGNSIYAFVIDEDTSEETRLLITPKNFTFDGGNIINLYGYNDTVTYKPNLYIGTTGKIRRTTYVVDNTSSKRFKHDIKDITNPALDPHRLYDIEVKQFRFNDDTEASRKGVDLIGFIAEQVEEVYPIAVDYDENGQVETWREHYIIPPMLKLIQEQHEQIDSLTKRIEALERNNK